MKVVIDGKEYILKDEPEEKKEEKPEIRYGNLYVRQHGHSFVVIGKEPESGRWLTLHSTGGQCYWKEDDIRKETRFSHNIFDDLAEGEDLEEFDVKAEGAHGEGFCGKISGSSIYLNCKSWYFNSSKTKEIIKGLRGLLVTDAKRKCKGKDC